MEAEEVGRGGVSTADGMPLFSSSVEVRVSRVRLSRKRSCCGGVKVAAEKRWVLNAIFQSRAFSAKLMSIQ
jgi:hypothetical protein